MGFDSETTCGVCGANLEHPEGDVYVECPLHMIVPRIIEALRGCVTLLEQLQEPNPTLISQAKVVIATARSVLAETEPDSEGFLHLQA